MKYYISTPIYYVNDAPHIGHVYTTLAADVIARFKRLEGAKVHFLTGTDEHGQKVEKTAIAKGYDPLSYCDLVSQKFRDVTKVMDFSNDDFIRTSDPKHKDVVAQIWQKMLESGDIYLDKYAGWYSVRDEAFYDESEIKDGKAPTGAPVEWVEEPSYFFRLSKWQDKLLELYENNPDFIMPHYRANEVIAFVKSGLRDLSVSRTSFSWGIKVPGDESHVIYVWLDALFYYYSAIQTPELKDFWSPDLQIVGKDILRFHAVYWPAFLMAVGLPLPKQIFAHGWWLVEGEKMSKSIGNVIDPFALKEEFGLDYLRYYLIREMPFGNDHSYSRELFITRINSELCNNIGNLCQRVLSFVDKNAGTKVPQNQNLNQEDKALLASAYGAIVNMRAHIEKLALHLAFEEVVNLGRLANEYIDRNAPWALRKTDVPRMEAVLYTLLEVIRIIGILLQPLIPGSANNILDTLNICKEKRSFIYANESGALEVGSELQSPEAIFPRIGT
ncbi:MAG: methionyl-tRNA ligase [Candidatus Midichloriaceae bacterium]|jgi:methionyl-tRNA synthetase|nr:methionyl-tRNA ligase [Candidatus Midichloriaceae bacterium]